MRHFELLCKSCVKSAVVVTAMSLVFSIGGMAQESDAATAAPAKKPKVVPGQLFIPSTSRLNAEDKGKKMHTNVRIIVPATGTPFEAPPFTGYGYETPASLACVYAVVTPVAGCNPNETVRTPEGGSETIAIVDAYDDPEAAADLAYFSDQFGLPFSINKFQVVYAAGYQPAVDYTGGWELEESLDIEYAHAMAPKAMLYLVEAASNADTDLAQAVGVATNLVRCGQENSCPATAKGKGEVSMSYGGAEYAGETSDDAEFKGKNVVYVASAGDSAGTSYPSVSPYVVSAGGTTTARSLATGNLIEEIAWSDAGGGISEYEAIPSYQAGIEWIAGGYRATPDISSDANPNTGVWVYDSYPMDGIFYPSSWWVVGGTSVSAPTLSGIINASSTVSGKFAASTAAELTKVYGALASKTGYPEDFHDIKYGACNYYSSSFSGPGYDLCTGVGSPKGSAGK